MEDLERGSRREVSNWSFQPQSTRKLKPSTETKQESGFSLQTPQSGFTCTDVPISLQPQWGGLVLISVPTPTTLSPPSLPDYCSLAFVFTLTLKGGAGLAVGRGKRGGSVQLTFFQRLNYRARFYVVVRTTSFARIGPKSNGLLQILFYFFLQCH